MKTILLPSAVLAAILLLGAAVYPEAQGRAEDERAIRAVAQDPEAAQMMGVNLDRTVDATFFLGSGLAAVAGILSGLYYSEVHFIMGITGGVIGFSAVLAISTALTKASASSIPSAVQMTGSLGNVLSTMSQKNLRPGLLVSSSGGPPWGLTMYVSDLAWKRYEQFISWSSLCCSG